MEPTKRSSGYASDNDDLSSQVGSLSLESEPPSTEKVRATMARLRILSEAEDARAVSAAFDSVDNAGEVIYADPFASLEAVTAAIARERLARREGIGIENTANDNNAPAPAPAPAPDFSTAVATAQAELIQAASISYEACLASIEKHAELLFTEQGVAILDGYLAAMSMLKEPKRPRDAASAIAFLTAVTEVGNSVFGCEHVKERLITRALELDLAMLVEILTAEPLNKQVLTSFAVQYEDIDLLTWLQRGILRELNLFRVEIKKDPVAVFERVKYFYLQRPESITFRDPKNGNSLLHEAFTEYLNGRAVGAIEFAVLLTLGVDKEWVNQAGFSVAAMAKNSELSLFVGLLEHKAPTEQVLLSLVLDALCETADPDQELQTLSEWLT